MPSAEGCSETAWLAERGRDVTGFDAAEQAAALALESARKAGMHIQAQVKAMEDFDMQSDINCGTGVPPVITAGTAVPRRDTQLFKSLCIE